MRVKAISLWQPWALAFVMPGVKEYETRSWWTSHRGPLLIHASKKDFKPADYSREFLQQLEQDGVFAAGLEYGCLVGVVDLSNVMRTEKRLTAGGISAKEQLYGDWSVNRYCWHGLNQRRFVRAIPYIGRQGFFDVDLDDWICKKYGIEFAVGQYSMPGVGA